MRFDECWYCLACETDCPKDAIVVKIPIWSGSVMGQRLLACASYYTSGVARASSR